MFPGGMPFAVTQFGIVYQFPLSLLNLVSYCSQRVNHNWYKKIFSVSITSLICTSADYNSPLFPFLVLNSSVKR